MVVSRISWNRIVGFAAFIGMSLVAIPACESSGLSEDIPINDNERITIMPSDLWTDYADSWLDSYIEKNPKFIVFCEFDEFREIQIYFDSLKIAYRAKIVGESKEEHNYYFDNERLIYSHSSTSNASGILAAYANNEPFAAAQGSEGNWEAVSPEHSQLHKLQRRKVVEVVKSFQEKEKRTHTSRRINAANNRVSGSINDSLGSKFYLNAREGDFLKIKLVSPSNEIYFTTRADNASKMEHRSWSGKIQQTGDVVIEVYTLDRTSNQPFTLFTELIPEQSRALTQEPSVAQASSSYQ